MSFNPLTWIGEALGIVDKGLDIAKEAVTDKDKQNELIANLVEVKLRLEYGEAYSQELSIKTIPWIDGLHKMGRQIINVLTIIIVALLILCGETITPEVALLLGGGNVAYQLIKGKGQ